MPQALLPRIDGPERFRTRRGFAGSGGYSSTDTQQQTAPTSSLSQVFARRSVPTNASRFNAPCRAATSATRSPARITASATVANTTSPSSSTALQVVPAGIVTGWTSGAFSVNRSSVVEATGPESR